MNKYRVQITISGAIHRPPYTGTVETHAWNQHQAAECAKRQLKASGVWFDIHSSDVRIDSVEYIDSIWE